MREVKPSIRVVLSVLAPWGPGRMPQAGAVRPSVRADLAVLGLFLAALAILSTLDVGPHLRVAGQAEATATATQWPAVDHVVARSLGELVHRSTIIVVGEREELDASLNGPLMPCDPSTQQPDHYDLGRLYRIRVNRYLKGDGP
jgi:hypothetical protein